MQIIRGLHNLKPFEIGCALTIGNFDGIHLGHQAILQQLRLAAAALHIPSSVMIFEPQPNEIINHDKPLARLSRLYEKIHFFKTRKIDYVLVVHFTEHFAAISPKQFVESILMEKIHIRHLVIGEDFRFGQKRKGDFGFLQKYEKKFCFSLEKAKTVIQDGRRISSSWVREVLQQGAIEKAQSLIGRPYVISGHVAHGDRRGHTLGFPTINVFLLRDHSPLLGIYAVKVAGIKKDKISGVASVGYRPTFGGKRVILEVYLLDFDEEIYGRLVHVEFLKKIRDERKFDDVNALIAQMQKDTCAAREFFRGIASE